MPRVTGKRTKRIAKPRNRTLVCKQRRREGGRRRCRHQTLRKSRGGSLGRRLGMTRQRKGGRPSKAGGSAQDFKQMTCSPLSDKYKQGDPVSPHDTCLPTEKIPVVKGAWNTTHPEAPIRATEPTQIWEEIKERVPTCKDDLCILNQSFMKPAIKTTIPSSSGGNETIDLTEYYAPKMPKEWKKNPTEWLSNIEMLEKMKPYEKAYPCFEFIGPTSIDFDKVLSDKQCVEKELCHFQLSKYVQGKNKKSKIGIIFNTDPHDKGGSHWISLFINIPKKLIFFFDSAGDKAPKEIEAFVKRVMAQGKALNIDFTFDQNYPNEHQFSTTECGMYSLYFIINMLEDKLTPEFLKTQRITDEKMMAFRPKYFNDV